MKRDQVVNVQADSLTQAAEKAQAVDMFAEICVIGESNVSLS